MSSINISCPGAGDHVVVTVQGSSPATGTICVKGTYAESLFLRLLLALLDLLVRLFRWIFRRRPVPRTTAVLSGLTVRVRVLNGTVTMAPSYTPKLANDVDIPASPSWCARPVQVPSWSSGGSSLTVFAWLLSGVGSGGTGGTLVAGPDSKAFFGGGSPPVDCCSGCASVSAAGPASVGAGLSSHPQLEVTVPDGPHAGLHRATAVSSLAWAVTVRGVTYEVCCDGGTALVVRGPSSSSAATSVESDPFSATFPGGVFGSAGDVLVTKA